MKRFHFPLARVMRLRAQRERAARRSLAAAVAVVARAQNQLTAVESTLDQCRDEIGAAAPLARGLERGLGAIKSRVERELSAAEESAEHAREVFRERRQELRVLESLRAREFEAWRVAANAAEQTELEELARMGAWRSSRGEG